MDERQEQLAGYGNLSETEMKGYFNGKDDLDAEMEHNNLPKKPKKGEMIICQICGEPLFPRQEKFLKNDKIADHLIMSKNKIDAKREFKFHIHSRCRDIRLNEADQQTPGLMAERKETERTYLED